MMEIKLAIKEAIEATIHQFDIRLIIGYLSAGLVRALFGFPSFISLIIGIVVCVPVGMITYHLALYFVNQSDTAHAIGLIAAFGSREILVIILAKLHFWSENPDQIKLPNIFKKK